MRLALEQVSKTFSLHGQPLPVLEQVSVELAAGESVALLGPSGCGKSTLLGLAAGFYPPDSGQVRREGRVSLMMQEDMLLPWRTVLENACLPVEIKSRRLLPAAREKAAELLPLFGLAGFGHSLPATLSGGMRQRAALLRLVMDEGDFWLLDEPFAKLDALTKEDLQDWLLTVRGQFSAGLLLVTHDIEEALRLCGRIYLLTPRPGRVLAELAVKPEDLPGQKAAIRALLRQAQDTVVNRPIASQLYEQLE